MAPFIIVAIVAGSLFTGGTVVKTQEPVIGTAMQVAGIGALVGGGIGSIASVPTALSITTLSAVTGGAVTGGVVGAGVGGVYAVEHKGPRG